MFGRQRLFFFPFLPECFSPCKRQRVGHPACPVPLTTIVPDAPDFPAEPPVPSVGAGRAPTPPPRTRKRFLLLLAITLIASAMLYAPLWQGLLRVALTHEARRHGGKLTIGRIEGGLFDTFQLYDVRLRGGGASVDNGRGTDLRVGRIDLAPERPRLPWRAATGTSWLREVALEGLSGRYDLTASPGSATAVPTGNSRSWLGRNAYRFVPGAFMVRSGNLIVRRGRYQLGFQGLRLNGSRDRAGLLLVKELEISGPGFRNTFLNRHAETVWRKNQLSISGLDFGPGVRLTSGMIDSTHLGRRHLDWEGTLAILGGEVRAQGGITLSPSHLGVELAGTLRELPVQSLARLVGLMGTAGGTVQQGSFSFRGDPENPAAAEMWLAGQATDFRWGRRRWQSLELQTVVLHGRVQVNRLELRQSRNQLSLRGEFPLAPLINRGGTAGGQPWWEAGFSGMVDARLDDLHAFSMLVGPRFPPLEGRMSINGTLEAQPGQTGIEGYLNVEGSQLMVRGVPLDYLRSTLIFQGVDLKVADLQTTRGSDYLTGKWAAKIVGASQYAGELQVAVKDRAVYAPALAGIINLGQLGLGPDDSHAPIQLDGTFHGPDASGGASFLATGAAASAVDVPLPAVGEWWRDD